MANPVFRNPQKQKNTNQHCTQLVVAGRETSDPPTLARLFNEHFSKMAAEAVASLNPSNLSPIDSITQADSSFSLSRNPITYTEIIEAADLLPDKKNPGSI